MKTKYLSASEKEAGIKRMYRFEMGNGVSYGLLGDTFAYILATEFAASNIALGYISSALYISGLIVPFVPRLLKGRNMIKVESVAWFFRGFLSLGYIGLFWATGQLAVGIILATYTLFCVSRSIGMMVNDFAVKSITTLSNRGEVMSGVNVAYNSMGLLTKFTASLLTMIPALSGVGGIVSLQMAGVAGNMYATSQIAKIPCRQEVTYRKGRTTGVIFREAFRDPEIRRRVLIKWSFLAATVVVNMNVPFMSRELGLSSSMVILYSVFIGVAVVLAGLVSRLFADRMGSKPLLLLSAVMLAIVSALWGIFDPRYGALAFFLIGFALNFAFSVANLMANRLVVNVIPDDEAMGFNAMTNFGLAVCALVAGLVSGVLVNLGFTMDLPIRLFNHYSLCFGFGTLIVILTLPLVGQLKEKGAKDASVLLSMHGLHALNTAVKLDKVSDPVLRRRMLLDLGTNCDEFATGEIRMKLNSPFSRDLRELINTLGDKPNPALTEDLIKIAKDDDSFVQLEAIGALGAYTFSPEAKETLVALLDDRWGAVRSMASKSLSRFGDVSYLEKIDELSHKARHIDEETDYLVAKHNLSPSGEFFRDFFISVKQGRSGTFRETRYAVIASFLRFGSPVLAHLYELYNNGDVTDFLTDFLTDARDVEAIDREYDSIMKAFGEQNFTWLLDFTLDMLRGADLSFSPQFSNLRRGLLSATQMDPADFDTVDMLALLYFSYSLAKNTGGPVKSSGLD